MICSFCGKEFDEEAATRSCKACSLFGGCKNARCPHCGYESPRETRLVKAIRNWRKRRNDRPAD